MPETTSAAPGQKSPRWSAERRASSRRRAQGASQAPRRAASRARRGTASWYPASLGAPPPLGVAKEKLKARAQNASRDPTSRNRPGTLGLPRVKPEVDPTYGHSLFAIRSPPGRRERGLFDIVN